MRRASRAVDFLSTSQRQVLPSTNELVPKESRVLDCGRHYRGCRCEVDKSSYTDLPVAAVTGGKLRNLAHDHAVHTNLSQVRTTPANIAESFDVVDELTRDEGLVTSEMVPALVSDEGDSGQGRPPMARYRY